jgi:subfamily B ATP-binding cassette protein MsbA
MTSSGLGIIFIVFRKYRLHVAALVVLGLISGILEGIGINAIIPLISAFTAGGPGEATDIISRTLHSLFDFFSIPFTFRYLLGFILALFLLRAMASVVVGYIRGWISSDFLSDETEDMLRTMMLSSWPFLLKQKMGTLEATAIRDVRQTASLLETLGQVIQSFTGFSMYLLVAFSISPNMTLYTLAGGAILIFFVRPLLSRARQTAERMIATEKNITQFLSEHIIGMKSIKAAGVERQALKVSNGYIHYFRDLTRRMALTRYTTASLFQPFSLIFVIVLLILTYKTPGFNIISFGAVLYLIQKIFTYLESGQGAFHNLFELIPYAQSMTNMKQQLLSHREEIRKGGTEFHFTHTLAFKDVYFGYESSRETLRGVSFEISPGETMGIVGPSGAGKTSIADLVLRLFTPSKGTIVLDSIPVEEISLEEWRKHIAYVSQDVFLLNASLEENIRFYHPNISNEQVIAAAKQANIYDFIMSLPEGFATTVGDRGVLLSGGQRQRVVLARALAQHPRVLVLDEATSALDHESEKLIQQAIESLHGDVAVITIAHRPSTVAHADKIVVVEKGEVVEKGSAEDLLRDTSSYFYKMQTLG